MYTVSSYFNKNTNQMIYPENLKIYTTKELAEQTGKSESTIRRCLVKLNCQKCNVNEVTTYTLFMITEEIKTKVLELI